MGLKIAVFGGTGLIGSALVRYFRQRDHRLTVFTRFAERHPFQSFPDVEVLPFDHAIHRALGSMDVVINLAGANISRRWTRKWKSKILHSRIDTTGAIVEALNKVQKKPELFIQGSAIGYYPISGDSDHNENSDPGRSFLSQVVVQWEKAVQPLNRDIRLAVVRTGVVISNQGGMLPRITLPIKTYMGGIPGSGNNWVSWIHLQDFVMGTRFLLDNTDLNGVFNFTSPQPVQMKDLIHRAADVLKKPVPFRIPPFLICLLLGDMGKEMVLGSQKVKPERLLNEGYKFMYPDIRSALKKELEN